MQSHRTRTATGTLWRRQVKRGHDGWYARYRLPDGRQVQRRLGNVWPERQGRPPYGFLTKRQAEAMLNQIKVDADRGVLDAAYAPSTGHTLAQACDEWLRWLQHEQDRKPSTLADYRAVVRRHLLPGFGGDTPLMKLDARAINRLRSQLLEGRAPTRENEKGRGPGTSPAGWKRTAQKVMMLLRAILNRAVKLGWLAVNPMVAVDPVKVPKSYDFNVLSREQVEAVARATESRSTRR